MPTIIGSTTVSVNNAAMAASTALPPAAIISTAAAEAKGWLVTAMPRLAVTAVFSQMKEVPARLRQSIFGPPDSSHRPGGRPLAVRRHTSGYVRSGSSAQLGASTCTFVGLEIIGAVSAISPICGFGFLDNHDFLDRPRTGDGSAPEKAERRAWAAKARATGDGSLRRNATASSANTLASAIGRYWRPGT